MIRRVLVWLSVVPAALVLAILICTGLVKAGLMRNPFGPVAGGDLTLAHSGKPGLRVLFVGNSLTFRNDLPALVHDLAAGDKYPVFAASYTAGGWQLRWFARDRGLDRLLHDAPWDVVVLQEQSQIPSFAPSDRAREFDPYVRELAQKIEAVGARPLLFVTWAHRLGDRRNIPHDTYAAMQQRLVNGYWHAARDAGAAVAPVGIAWAEALRRRPQLELWSADGTHPSERGSYLAACVFYATLTGRTPEHSAFRDGLRDARFLQRVAWTVVHRRY